MQVEEDNIIRKIVKREMAFAKDDPYPCLMVESSSNEVPNLDIAGSDLILQSLLK